MNDLSLVAKSLRALGIAGHLCNLAEDLSMKPFLNDRGLLVCAVATSLLVGCVSSSPIDSTPFSSTRSDAMGLARVPSAPAVVPEVIHPDANFTLVTLLYGGRPILRGSKAWLVNDKGEVVRQTVTDADGFAHFRLVPPTEALKLQYLAEYESCTGVFPNIECTKSSTLYQWPAKVHDPPFPTYLECDANAIRELCKKP
jgi:hypothetical protein